MTTESKNTDDLGLMTPRERDFALFYLASKRAKWSAKQAGFIGDMSKRTRSLLDRPRMRRFLAKYSAAPSGIEISEGAVLRRLAQIASGQITKVNTSDIIKCLELLGKHLGIWEGSNKQGKDRLQELIDAFNAGPVSKKETEQ